MSVPLGTILSWVGLKGSVPKGFLLCDGAESYPNADYPELARFLIGIDERLADGTAGFRTPDLRGKFLRMAGGNALGLLEPQNDEFGSHTHDYSEPSGDHFKLQFGPARGTGPGGIQPNRPPEPGIFTIHAAGGNETRPENVAVLFIIRALP